MSEKDIKPKESSTESNPSAQEQLEKLQTELQQNGEDVTVESYTQLEGQLLAKIRNSRGIIGLILKRHESGFDKLGGKHADEIDPEKVESTFNWLKAKKLSDFHNLSAYLENVEAESRSQSE